MVESTDVGIRSPLQPDIPRYRDLISRVDEDLHTQGLWEEIVQLAESEEGTPLAHVGYFGDLSLREMVDIKDRLESASTKQDQFEVLGESASNGKLWYDILLGHYNDAGLQAMGNVLQRMHFPRGLDLGSGYGNSLEELQKHVDSAVGLDQSTFLQAIARKRVPESHVATGDALKLPFKDHSFDVIMANGLTKYLPDREMALYAKEIARVLDPEGLYLEVVGMPNEDGSIPIDEDTLENAKGVVANYLTDLASWQEPQEEGEQSSFAIQKNAFEAEGFTMGAIADKRNGVYVIEYFKEF